MKRTTITGEFTCDNCGLMTDEDGAATWQHLGYVEQPLNAGDLASLQRRIHRGWDLCSLGCVIALAACLAGLTIRQPEPLVVTIAPPVEAPPAANEPAHRPRWRSLRKRDRNA